MTKIMKGGIAYNSTSNMVALTQAEYNSLTSAQKNNGTFYFITDANPDYYSASYIDYDNTSTGLVATNVQSAIDEISSVSTLAGLSDVTLTTPTNNDVLKYDSTSGVWKNSNSITVSNVTADSTTIKASGQYSYPRITFGTTSDDDGAITLFNRNTVTISRLSADSNGHGLFNVFNSTANSGVTLRGSNGNIESSGGDLCLKTAGSSSDDSGDIVWYYGNGQEKARIWLNNTYTAASGLNYRLYKSDGTSLHNGTIPLTDTTYSAGTGLSLSSGTFSVKTGYTTSGNNRKVQADSSGNLYVTQKDDDTKNTAGSTDTSSKIFLIGATSQAANPQTYSDNQVYAQSGDLTSNRFVSLSKTASYINKDQVAGLLAKKTEATTAWYAAVCLDTYGGGHWQIGNYNDERLVFCYGTKTNKNAGTNKTQRFYLPVANNNNDLTATIAVYLEKTYSVTIGTNTYDGLYYADINVSATATNYHVLDLSVVSVTGNHWASITYYTTNNIRVWTKATGITVEVKVMGIAV